MSITSAMFAGVSGLSANSSALAAISDNIANMNTVGYKRNATQFTNLVRPESSTTTYATAGVSVAMHQLISQQGVLQSTASSTDLAVSGQGFFVVGDSATGGETLFTRAGSFVPDDQGYLKNTGGFYLKGWPIGANGTVSADPSDLSALQPINVASIGAVAEASTNLSVNANLDSSTVTSAAAGTYAANTPATNMASGAVTPDFSRTVQVYDSLGGSRSLTFSFLKTATPNVWRAEIYASPATDVTTGAGLVNGQVAVGNVAFNEDGSLNTGATTLPASLTFGASSSAAPTGTNVKWATAEGIAGQTISLSLGGSGTTGGMTQFDSLSTLNSTSVDGSPLGNLTGVSIGRDGVLTAQFDNGLQKALYKLPVATFVNADGLYALRGGAFRATAESGAFTLKEAGTAGAGITQASALENSNVDLAAEFTGLITTQRAYSASSKIITTADEMLDELIRIKR
jgi:flagellar hook protein FlgE